MISKIKKLIEFFPYYLEVFAKKLGGRGIMNPNNNGEFKVLEEIVKNSESNEVCFFDGGANFGNHSMKFLSFCEMYEKIPLLYSVEPFPKTFEKLNERISVMNKEVLNISLGNEKKKVKFYFNEEEPGSNSNIPHYYLNKSTEVEQDTIDNIIEKKNIKKINFLKLDIEGFEWQALQGTRKALESNMIDYIQLEYNGTWVDGGGSIKKIFDLCKLNTYSLFIITKNHLLSIPSYHMVLDDFYYSNLLMIKKGKDKLLPVKRKAIPFLSN